MAPARSAYKGRRQCHIRICPGVGHLTPKACYRESPNRSIDGPCLPRLGTMLLDVKVGRPLPCKEPQDRESTGSNMNKPGSK